MTRPETDVGMLVINHVNKKIEEERDGDHQSNHSEVSPPVKCRNRSAKRRRYQRRAEAQADGLPSIVSREGIEMSDVDELRAGDVDVMEAHRGQIREPHRNTASNRGDDQ